MWKRLLLRSKLQKLEKFERYTRKPLEQRKDMIKRTTKHAIIHEFDLLSEVLEFTGFSDTVGSFTAKVFSSIPGGDALLDQANHVSNDIDSYASAIELPSVVDEQIDNFTEALTKAAEIPYDFVEEEVDNKASELATYYTDDKIDKNLENKKEKPFFQKLLSFKQTIEKKFDEVVEVAAEKITSEKRKEKIAEKSQIKAERIRASTEKLMRTMNEQSLNKVSEKIAHRAALKQTYDSLYDAISEQHITRIPEQEAILDTMNEAEDELDALYEAEARPQAPRSSPLQATRANFAEQARTNEEHTASQTPRALELAQRLQRDAANYAQQVYDDAIHNVEQLHEEEQGAESVPYETPAATATEHTQPTPATEESGAQLFNASKEDSPTLVQQPSEAEPAQLLQQAIQAKLAQPNNLVAALSAFQTLDPFNSHAAAVSSSSSNDAKFSVSEDACSQLEQFFKEAIDDATASVLTVFQELAKINALAKYQIVMTHTQNFADNYREEFQQELLTLFDVWQSEGESMHQFILNLDGGSDADDESVVAANELEHTLREIVVEALAKEPDVYKGSNLVDLSGYGGKEKLFTDIHDVLHKFNEDMGQLLDEVEATAAAKGEDNELYLNVGTVLSSMLTAYKSLFETFNEGMVENLADYVSAKSARAIENVETNKEQLKQSAENTKDMLKDISSLFQL